MALTKLVEVRLERKRKLPIADKVIPSKNAGFWANRSCCEKVMALTKLVEVRFEAKKKTARVVFVELLDSYNTEWQKCLLLKLLRTIK